MGVDDPVVRVTPGELQEADPTPGMVREEAIAVGGMWAGLVRTEARAASGWHHHGDHDTTIYVVEGDVRIEFGPDGERVMEAGPGDFIHVPKHVVHRESNPADVASRIVVVRAGRGPTTINVQGPHKARKD